MTCGRCGGTGELGPGLRCEACKGTGQVPDHVVLWTCPACGTELTAPPGLPAGGLDAAIEAHQRTHDEAAS